MPLQNILSKEIEMSQYLNVVAHSGCNLLAVIHYLHPTSKPRLALSVIKGRIGRRQRRCGAGRKMGRLHADAIDLLRAWAAPSGLHVQPSSA